MPGRSAPAQSYLEEATRLEAAGRQWDAIAALMKAVRLARTVRARSTISVWAA
jgi:hypothetical protein